MKRNVKDSSREDAIKLAVKIEEGAITHAGSLQELEKPREQTLPWSNQLCQHLDFGR